jgi:DHA1 family bicyclomycin/chloramphenicol resistance-like MFS transporter
MGLLAIGCVLIAENGKLFGVGEEYKDAPPTADVH